MVLTFLFLNSVRFFHQPIHPFYDRAELFLN